MPIDVNRADLDAYVDGQLDPWQRMAVEDWLARHPADAAAVMASLRQKTELKLALAIPEESRTDLRAAKRLGKALDRPAWLGIGLPSAAVIVAALALWIGVSPLSVRQGFAAPPPPPFVESALAAREASTLRLAMLSQPEAPDFDPVEIRALTGLVTPHFPAEWVPRDAQVFPSPLGPGLEMIFDTPNHGRLSLFIVRVPSGDSFGSTSLSDVNLAWFIEDDVAHILGATIEPAQLIEAVDFLRASLTN